MKFKKKLKSVVLIALGATLVLGMGACATGNLSPVANELNSASERRVISPVAYDLPTTPTTKIVETLNEQVWMVWQVEGTNPPQAEDFINPNEWWDLTDFWEAWNNYWTQYDLIITDKGVEGLYFQMVNGDDVMPSFVPHSEVERIVGSDGTRITFDSKGAIVLHGSFIRITTRQSSSQLKIDGESITISHPMMVYDDRIYIPIQNFQEWFSFERIL